MCHQKDNIVASELKDPICHSNECQIGSFSSEATIYYSYNFAYPEFCVPIFRSPWILKGESAAL